MAMAGWQEVTGTGPGKRPGAGHGRRFTVTAEMLRKRPEMAGDGYRIGDQVSGSVLHAKYSRYMQQVAEIEPELVERWQKKVAVSPTTPRLRQPERFLCRWPITLRMELSPALPTITAATLFAKVRRARRK